MSKRGQKQSVSQEGKEEPWWRRLIKAFGIEVPVLMFVGVIVGVVLCYLYLSEQPLWIGPLIANAVRETVEAQPTVTLMPTCTSHPSPTPVSPTPAATATPTYPPTYTPTATPTDTPSTPYPTPSNLVKHFDSEALVDGWSDGLVLDEKLEIIQTLRGAAMLPAEQDERGVVYELKLYENKWVYYIIEYTEPMQADVIVAQFYLPDTPDIQENVVAVQVVYESRGPLVAKSFTSIPPGEWTQIILDLRGRNDPTGAPLNTRPLFVQVHFGVIGRSPLESDTVLAGLSDVAWYETTGELAP